MSLAQKVHKSRAHRMRMAEDGYPQEIEKTETRRWATTIAGFIADSPLPAKEIAESTGDPVTTWVRLCGNRRARTLRQAARSWQKFHEWLKLAYGLCWPSSISQIIDYLEERALEPCGHTVPGSLLGSLQLLESVGGQEREQRLGSSPVLVNVVRNLGKDLATGGPPRKTAPIFTVAMILAAELLVADPGQSDVARMMAYIMLLMVWGALRADDVLWLDRAAMPGDGMASGGRDDREGDIQARVEAKNLGVLRQVSFSDRNALLNAYERVHGRLEDRETPSVDYISQKVEEVEQGELMASPLDEVGSKEESLTLGVQSSLDAAGRLRITREKKKSKLPANSEELRAKLKLEGNTLIMLGAKFRNRAWFQDLSPNDFSKFADWLLGEKVYGLPVPKAASEGSRPLNPPWAILLRFEHQVRKDAYKQSIRQNRAIRFTLAEAMVNAELKDVHFLSPVALAITSPEIGDASTKQSIPGASEENPTWVPNKFLKKGKGKGKTGRYDKRYGSLHSTTPDGRQICYAFQEGKCKGNCGRVDVCQLCLKPHPLKDCKFKAKAARAAKTQEEKKTEE